MSAGLAAPALSLPLLLALVSAALWSVAGLLGGGLEPRRSGPRLFAALAVGAGTVGLVGAGAAFVAGGRAVPSGAGLVGLDALSALFLVPISLTGGAVALFGLGSWHDGERTGPGRRLRLALGLTVAALVLVVLARHALVFLVAWEVMALGAFFLVGTEEDRPGTRRAAWIYLASAHLAFLALAGLFALLRATAGSFRLEPLAAGIAATPAGTLLFWLALVGFGLKAGLFPLHVWLPPAHAAAPSHVSALLSGVVIKIGIYGLVRVLSLVPDPPAWWGGTVLAVGAVSALTGVLSALGQHDLKRLLAYHSVENVGIIALGVGLGTLGRTRGETAWVLLGLSGGLLHVVNHGLFKPLLFLSAGNVVHATGTREIDRLGGLARRMPGTALAFSAGAVAICGLPPLNGFVSEWLVYLGLVSTVLGRRVPDAALAALAAAALALVGGLAVACFVKAFGAVFLGEARTDDGREARDGGALLLAPMAILGAACLLVGLGPALLAGPLGRAVSVAAGPSAAALGPLAAVAPLRTLGAVAWAIAGSLALAAFLGLRARSGFLRDLRRPAGDGDAAASTPAVTWDCGYAAPTPRMQYTSSSFAATLVRTFRGVLFPRHHRPDLTGGAVPEPGRLFPAPATFSSHVPDAVLDVVLEPAFAGVARVAARLRAIQSGRAQTYLLYVFVTLVVLLLTL